MYIPRIVKYVMSNHGFSWWKKSLFSNELLKMGTTHLYLKIKSNKAMTRKLLRKSWISRSSVPMAIYCILLAILKWNSNWANKIANTHQARAAEKLNAFNCVDCTKHRLPEVFNSFTTADHLLKSHNLHLQREKVGDELIV